VRVQRANVQRVPIEEGQEFASFRTGAYMKIVAVPGRSGGDNLMIERRFPSRTRWAPQHVHADFGERFTILDGVADASIGSSELRLGEGKVHYAAPYALHSNPTNRSKYPLAYQQTFEPATEGARSYVRTLAQVLADGRDEDGELPWSLVLAIGDVTREHTYARHLPYGFQRRVLLPLGNYIAGTRNLGVQLARVPRLPPDAPLEAQQPAKRRPARALVTGTPRRTGRHA
jgi:mannose-6-phosphate isomerase-like protein (cupin superfamily)